MLTSGLIPMTSGTIEIDGARVTQPYTDLGIVFQQDLLMDWRRVQANILVQPEFRGLRVKDYERRARALLNLVGLSGCEKNIRSSCQEGCASGSPFVGRWSTTRTCCSWMNRSARWMR